MPIDRVDERVQLAIVGIRSAADAPKNAAREPRFQVRPIGQCELAAKFDAAVGGPNFSGTETASSSRAPAPGRAGMGRSSVRSSRGCASERLQHDEKHDRNQQRQRGNLVQPAIEHMTMAIAVLGEIAKERAQVDVKRNERRVRVSA